MNINEKTFDFSQLKFSFNIADTDYQLDALQSQMLQFYLVADRKFRRAFNQNYTPSFLTFLKDKARLHEPVHLSVTGQVRGGKTYTAVTICIFHQAQYKRLFTSEYICSDSYEFLEKLQSMPEEKLLDRIFLIDEQKQGVWGTGSIAKKIKLEDVQNIIAINNISTISICPTQWANKESHYGLRVFGRCFKTKTCRMMLYNLQEKGRGGELPMGNIYLPIFTSFLPKDYAEQLEKEYLKRKHEWVGAEMRGEKDVLSRLKKQLAQNFVKDKQFLSIRTQKDRLTYIRTRLGSEWTLGESSEILSLTKLIEEGITFDKDEKE
jgi:hypothetical protein